MNRKEKTEKFAVNSLMFILIILLLSLFTFNLQAQEPQALGKQKLFKKIYEDVLKYGTFYIAGNINNPYQKQTIDYVVRTNSSGSLYDVPIVEDATNYLPFDYRYGFGLRRIARFDYENKEKAYYDGTEKNVALSAPTAAFSGFEYMFHWEKEREVWYLQTIVTFLGIQVSITLLK
jgi:hypothetical protein